jgi:Fe-S cluster biogenesis protein NfuA
MTGVGPAEEKMEQDISQKVQQVVLEIGAILEADGVKVELLKVTDEGEVQLKLIGICSTCDNSMMTLKKGIEKMIQEQAPGVKQVSIF